MPCVVKPLMSSSGKGQSVIRTEADIETAWNYALEGSRGDLAEIIVEAFIDFDYEITLLTLTQDSGNTLFCAPIGHRQERGDYQESWQPAVMEPTWLATAQEMAAAVTKELGGSGIWGVEFFIQNPRNGQPGTVYFRSSPSPARHGHGDARRNPELLRIRVARPRRARPARDVNRPRPPRGQRRHSWTPEAAWDLAPECRPVTWPSDDADLVARATVAAKISA